jgi:hypothetical protein
MVAATIQAVSRMGSTLMSLMKTSASTIVGIQCPALSVLGIKLSGTI